MKITYSPSWNNRGRNVFIDGKKVGVIYERSKGFQYQPEGSRTGGGEIFPTLLECQRSLESDEE